MKLLIVSDLHLEFGNTYVPPQTGYDVVIIAGDISNPASRAVHWAKRDSTFGCARDVVYVPGNHEFYGTVLQPGSCPIPWCSSTARRRLRCTVLSVPLRTAESGQCRSRSASLQVACIAD
jgi:predicted phosphodiesterase